MSLNNWMSLSMILRTVQTEERSRSAEAESSTIFPLSQPGSIDFGDADFIYVKLLIRISTGVFHLKVVFKTK